MPSSLVKILKVDMKSFVDKIHSVSLQEEIDRLYGKCFFNLKGLQDTEPPLTVINLEKQNENNNHSD